MKIIDASFVKALDGPEAGPGSDLPEICFVGRSNVGKSSMINRLAMRTIARTSSTPGATRMINIYKVHCETGGARRWVIFSDFPGFGYARVSKGIYGQWERMIDGYVRGNDRIRRIIWLVDVRRDPDALDDALVRWMRETGIEFTVVLTKIDKESRGYALSRKAMLERLLPGVQVFLFSAKEGHGRKEVLSHVLESTE